MPPKGCADGGTAWSTGAALHGPPPENRQGPAGCDMAQAASETLPTWVISMPQPVIRFFPDGGPLGCRNSASSEGRRSPTPPVDRRRRRPGAAAGRGLPCRPDQADGVRRTGERAQPPAPWCTQPRTDERTQPRTTSCTKWCTEGTATAAVGQRIRFQTIRHTSSHAHTPWPSGSSPAVPNRPPEPRRWRRPVARCPSSMSMRCDAWAGQFQSPGAHESAQVTAVRRWRPVGW